MTGRHLQLLVVLLGAAIASLGLGLVFMPAGIIAAGLASVTAGVFLIDDGRKP